MVHALFQLDCTETCVGNACTQPSYNDKNLSSVFVLISLYVFTCLKLSRSFLLIDSTVSTHPFRSDSPIYESNNKYQCLSRVCYPECF